MVDEATLRAYLDGLLTPEVFHDGAPNGLQVQGTRPIQRLVTGVTASLALLDAAAAWDADAVCVHHGFFWAKEPRCLLGPSYQRVATLVRHGMGLFAYHLPLDAHPVWGNNRQLATTMGWEVFGEVVDGHHPSLMLHGHAPTSTLGALCDALAERLAHRPCCVSAHGPDDVHWSTRPVRHVAWCTGAAQDGLVHAAALGCDAYISGEISERTTHMARELGVHYVAAGHHATERGGVRALGEHLATRFALDHCFIDVPNPV